MTLPLTYQPNSILIHQFSHLHIHVDITIHIIINRINQRKSKEEGNQVCISAFICSSVQSLNGSSSRGTRNPSIIRLSGHLLRMMPQARTRSFVKVGMKMIAFNQGRSKGAEECEEGECLQGVFQAAFAEGRSIKKTVCSRAVVLRSENERGQPEIGKDNINRERNPSE